LHLIRPLSVKRETPCLMASARYPLIAIVLILLLAGTHVLSQNGPSFRVNHSSTVQYFSCIRFINTRDNGTVMIGKHGTVEDMEDLMVIKLDHLGKELWSKKIPVGLRLDNYFLCETTDGNIVLTANSQYNGAPINSDLLLIKLTCKGNILWNKQVTMKSGVSHRYLSPFALNAGKNNDVLLSFYSGELNWQYLVICRINESGNLVWSKTFYGTDGETNHPAVPFISGNKVVVLGFNDLYRNTWNFDKSFFGMVINYDDGTVENTKGYEYSEHRTYYGVQVGYKTSHFYAEQLTGGGYALFGEFYNYDLQHHYFYKLILNEDLSIKDKITYSTSFELGRQHSKIKVFPNGQAHILMMHADYKTMLWYTADPLNTKIREQKLLFPGANIDHRFMMANKGTDKSTIVASKMSIPLGSIEMIQLQDGDHSIDNCLGNDSSVIQLVPWEVYNGTMVWDRINNNEIVLNNLSFSAQNISITTSYLCEPDNNNTSPAQQMLKIVGSNNICSATSSYLFTGRSSANLPVIWAASTFVVLNSVNDSSVSLTFNRIINSPETFKLFATAGSCEVLMDSMEITVYPDHYSLPGNYTDCDLPLTFEPDLSVKNYLWDNGSTQRVRTVNTPGKYYVRMENYCSEIITDTVFVAGGYCDTETPPPSSSGNKIYVPNAFTPNRDGKNDLFIPGVTGNISSYDLSIYNRWGQLVFKTTDHRKGWDGNIKDAAQSSNMFVYKINYRFQGEEPKTVHGTVVLIR
jgi:gliding motility-associated-like protein